MRINLHVLAAGTAASALLAVLLPRRRAGSARCVVDAVHSAPVGGCITLTALGERTLAECDLTGLAPGLHGLHVHRCGDLSRGCASTCDHYNPSGARHGGPTGPHRHRGDFGNVLAGADGTCRTTVVAEVRLDELLGRAFVVHAGEDDLGQGGDAESLATGNAGARIACGLIVAD